MGMLQRKVIAVCNTVNTGNNTWNGVVGMLQRKVIAVCNTVNTGNNTWNGVVSMLQRKEITVAIQHFIPCVCYVVLTNSTQD